MREAKVGVFVIEHYQMIDQQSIIYIKDYNYIVDALLYSRNLFENIKKYLQFQLTVGINLTLFILLGTIIYCTPPLSPS